MSLRWTAVEIFERVETGSDDEEENLDVNKAATMTNNTDRGEK